MQASNQSTTISLADQMAVVLWNVFSEALKLQYKKQGSQQVSQGTIATIRSLIKIASPNYSDWHDDDIYKAAVQTTLHLAAQITHEQGPQLVKLLLENKADADATNGHDQHAITTACRRGNFPVARVFLEEKSITKNKLDIFAWTLNSALNDYQAEREPIVKLIIAEGFNLQYKNEHHSIHLAAQYATPAIVRSLLELKIDANLPNGAKDTPLHYALKRDQAVEIVAALLEHKADPNATNGSGTTPLHLVFNEVDSAELLIAAGAKLKARDGNLQTPLHSAAAKGAVDIASLLIEQKAELNSVDTDGNTPLHLYFAREDNKSHAFIKKLLCLGANYELANNARRTAVQVIPEFPKFTVHMGVFCKAFEAMREEMTTFHSKRKALIAASPMFRTRKEASAATERKQVATPSDRDVFTIVQVYLFGKTMITPGSETEQSTVQYFQTYFKELDEQFDALKKTRLEKMKAEALAKSSTAITAKPTPRGWFS